MSLWYVLLNISSNDSCLHPDLSVCRPSGSWTILQTLDQQHSAYRLHKPQSCVWTHHIKESDIKSNVLVCAVWLFTDRKYGHCCCWLWCPHRPWSTNGSFSPRFWFFSWLPQTDIGHLRFRCPTTGKVWHCVLR